MRYFGAFPIINYDGYFARNILARVGFDQNVKAFAPNFYPYTVKESDRPDSLSYNYYDNADNEWLIYLVNDIVDPYHDYRLTSEDFDSYITKKYGGIQEASRQTAFYRNNWESDDQTITTAAYSAKTEKERFFWEPVIGYSGEILGYERKKSGVIVSTNKIVELSTSEQTTQPTVGERLMIDSSNYGTVVSSNSTIVMVQHVVGTFPDSAYTASGETSNVSISVTGATTIQESLDAEIQAYFSPVSMYTYEIEKNEQKKHINLLDNRFSAAAEKKISGLLA